MVEQLAALAPSSVLGGSREVASVPSGLLPPRSRRASSAPSRSCLGIVMLGFRGRSVPDLHVYLSWRCWAACLAISPPERHVGLGCANRSRQESVSEVATSSIAHLLCLAPLFALLPRFVQ